MGSKFSSQSFLKVGTGLNSLISDLLAQNFLVHSTHHDDRSFAKMGQLPKTKICAQKKGTTLVNGTLMFNGSVVLGGKGREREREGDKLITNVHINRTRFTFHDRNHKILQAIHSNCKITQTRAQNTQTHTKIIEMVCNIYCTY
jgi:hypothetical protein